MPATDNFLRSPRRLVRWTVAGRMVAAVLAYTLSSALPAHAQHEHKAPLSIMSLARCAIPESSPPALRTLWLEEKEKLAKARKALADGINKKLSERCKGVEANSKQAAQCAIRQQEFLQAPEVGDLNRRIEQFCNLVKTAATCSADRGTDGEGPQKYFCRLMTPHRYNLACVDTIITGFKVERTTPVVCDLGDDRARKKACFNCGEAYFRQLQSALRNPAEMRTPDPDRNKQSAVQQSNAAYASCWGQVEASGEACSKTCGRRLFAQIVGDDKLPGCVSPP